MITVTSKSFHDKIQVDNDEVILNGTPDHLTGQIMINNNQLEKLSIKELPVTHSTKSILSKGTVEEDALHLGIRLRPNERRNEIISHRLSSQTPPGIYESMLQVGGKTRKLKLVVQPCIKVNINPLNFTFQGTSPGIKHTTHITLSNVGNMPFQVPDVKHATMLDMDFLCKATALAIRSSNALESYNSMMDELTKQVSKTMTDWLVVDLAEKGQIIAPGSSMLVTLTIILPKNADPKRDYSGEIRLWDQVLSYSINTYNI